MMIAERDNQTVMCKRESWLLIVAKARAWASEGWPVVITPEHGKSYASSEFDQPARRRAGRKSMSMHKAALALLGGLLAFAAAAMLTSAACAQNLDRGKPPARLFADSCTTCHRSARGLAKGRFSLTLYWFLKEHYASNSESAWTLATYLESVDSGSRRSPAAAKPSPPAASSQPGLRPPMPVPGR